MLLFCSLRLLFYHVLVENLGLMVSMEVINDTKYPKNDLATVADVKRKMSKIILKISQ